MNTKHLERKSPVGSPGGQSIVALLRGAKNGPGKIALAYFLNAAMEMMLDMGILKNSPFPSSKAIKCSAHGRREVFGTTCTRGVRGVAEGVSGGGCYPEGRGGRLVMGCASTLDAFPSAVARVRPSLTSLSCCLIAWISNETLCLFLAGASFSIMAIMRCNTPCSATGGDGGVGGGWCWCW